MGAGTSDNRHNECSNIRGIYGEKVGWKFGLNLPYHDGSLVLLHLAHSVIVTVILF
jgi:hypothetical protein